MITRDPMDAAAVNARLNGGTYNSNTGSAFLIKLSSDALRRHERTCKAISHSSDGDGSTDNDKRPLKRICPTREPRSQDHPDNWMYPLFEDVDSLIDQNMHMPDFASDISFSLDWLYPASLFESDITLAERLEYLAYFTSARGMATFLDRDTLRGKQNIISEHYKTAISSTNTAIEEEDHALLPKTIEIVSNIQSTLSITDTTITASSIPSWTTEAHNAAMHFFSPANIHRFLTFFWALWYPNCPIVHRPFFDPSIASPALLAVMVIIGACLSPDEEDGRMARKWMDAVEIMTFRQEWFGENKVDTPRIGEVETKWKSRLECIQTAYLVCSLQKREGSFEAQGRVRRYRHAMMVTVCLYYFLEEKRC